MCKSEMSAKPELWEKVVRKLRGHLMPPPGEPRPEAKEVDEFVASLEAISTKPPPNVVRAGPRGRASVESHRVRDRGPRSARREIDARAMLPADLASDGFDNIADVLQFSDAPRPIPRGGPRHQHPRRG
jgi:hypothetical protein